jgi:nucleoid DNA-binding protein
MKKSDFIKEVAWRSDTTIERAKRIINSMEDLIMEIIALEDKVTFTFGTIGGETTPPRRLWDFQEKKVTTVPPRPGQPYYKPSKKAKEY